MSLVPRPPIWAPEMPSPEPGETFRAYWERMGLGHEVDAALEGLTEHTIDLAHYRIWENARATCPAVFARYLSDRVSSLP